MTVPADASRRARPTGKWGRLDMRAVERLWGLLYRAVRRTVQNVDGLTQRMAAIEADVRALHRRIDDADRRRAER